jgi:hypothetical protein
MALSIAAYRRLVEDLYGARNFLGSLMRHFLAIRALTRRVIAGAMARPLVPLPGSSERSAPRSLPARSTAVPISAIASRAQEEDLPAIGCITDDKSERVHVPGEDGPKNWTSDSCRANNNWSHPRPVDDMRAPSANSGLSLFVGPSALGLHDLLRWRDFHAASVGMVRFPRFLMNADLHGALCAAEDGAPTPRGV